MTRAVTLSPISTHFGITIELEYLFSGRLVNASALKSSAFTSLPRQGWLGGTRLISMPCHPYRWTRETQDNTLRTSGALFALVVQSSLCFSVLTTLHSLQEEWWIFSLCLVMCQCIPQPLVYVRYLYLCILPCCIHLSPAFARSTFPLPVLCA